MNFAQAMQHVNRGGKACRAHWRTAQYVYRGDFDIQWGHGGKYWPLPIEEEATDWEIVK